MSNINKIAQLCLTHFNSLPKTGKPTNNEWTVLCCIVLEINKKFEVVSLGTGLKCIGRNQMSLNGDILNDSHAEVICRRAFLNYLYEQLNLAFKRQSLILNFLTDHFELKNGVEFHFFTTHTPCGDASIFPKPIQEDFGLCIESKKRPIEDTNPPKRLKVETTDTYRTGAKCLPEEQQDLHQAGLEYHHVGAVRTKPGRGDPTLSVSCSDKIAKWIHLGIQGALLSTFIPAPIVPSSFTIVKNTPFDVKALERAFHARLNLNGKLLIAQADECFEYARNEQKIPCPSSIVWNQTEMKHLEVVVNGKKQGVTKKNINSGKGRVEICKVQLFNNYYEAKQRAKDYQERWKELKENHFKVWTRKDEAFLQFAAD